MARQLAVPLVEGDAFHPPENIRKMERGVALTDDDRAGWLQTLGGELSRHPGGVVLSCSALKAAYRDSLRRAAPGLAFVHLDISQQESLKRVGQRTSHFYPPSLVASQFEILEDPSGEAGVLVLHRATAAQQAREAVAWLQGPRPARADAALSPCSAPET